MNVLAIRHVGHLCITADAKCAARALVDESDLGFLARQLRLAEPRAEQLSRYVLVLLADLYFNTIILAVNDAALSPGVCSRHQCQEKKPDSAHLFNLSPVRRDSNMQTLKSLSSNYRDAHHSQMLTQIPTHLIAGPLGAGKTSLIRSLMSQKPAGERWAVLINEFGQIGLDAALLSTDDSGISLAEVAGGCLCCVNGVPFQVGLSRLLRKAQPDRLLIEPSGLGHPAELMSQLTAPPWRGVLALQPSVTVLDAAALARGDALPSSQRQALSQSGLLLLNKSEGLTQAGRERIAAQLPSLPLRWTEQGELPINELPGLVAPGGLDRLQADLPAATTPVLANVWLDPAQPFCQSQGNDDGWSIGWRWHPSQRFDLERVAQSLGGLGWRRAKLVMQGTEGWCSANALAGDALAFKPSAWRRDSRLELIFDDPQGAEMLSATIQDCRI